MQSALERVRQVIITESKGSESRAWAESTFDEKLLNALPSLVNKKHFTKLSHEATVAKLDQIYKHLHLLLETKNKVRSKQIVYHGIVKTFDGLL